MLCYVMFKYSVNWTCVHDPSAIGYDFSFPCDNTRSQFRFQAGVQFVGCPPCTTNMN